MFYGKDIEQLQSHIQPSVTKSSFTDLTFQVIPESTVRTSDPEAEL